MDYAYFILPQEQVNATPLREALFARMQEEKLLRTAMHAYHNPCLQDWLTLSQSPQSLILCCMAQEHDQGDVQKVRGMALLSPWQGRVWSFDFTAFRAHFPEAASMCRGGLQWIFDNLPCDSVMGLSAISNRHAWRLAEQSGFSVLGTVPGACYVARKYQYQDGVLVLAKRQDWDAIKAHQECGVSPTTSTTPAYANSRPIHTARPMMRTKSCVCSQLSTSMGP